jgi:hypothetical protein
MRQSTFKLSNPDKALGSFGFIHDYSILKDQSFGLAKPLPGKKIAKTHPGPL